MPVVCGGFNTESYYSYRCYTYTTPLRIHGEHEVCRSNLRHR